jgi:hypothetical protein
MFRYNLRSLLILLAILPPLLWIGWTKYEAWRAKQQRLRMAAEISQQIEVTWLQMTLPVPQPPPDSSDLQHGQGP